MDDEGGRDLPLRVGGGERAGAGAGEVATCCGAIVVLWTDGMKG